MLLTNDCLAHLHDTTIVVISSLRSAIQSPANVCVGCGTSSDVASCCGKAFEVVAVA